ncbi:hypothetical protein KI387_002984, partial [Taxus chinensis]
MLTKKSGNLSETNVLMRNDTRHIVHPQIGFTNSRSSVEDSNNYMHVRISGTAEEEKEKSDCTQIYCRKNSEGQTTNKDLNACTSESSSCTTEEDIADANKRALCNLTSTIGTDFEIKKWCISILKDNGSLGSFSQIQGDVECPGIVGDGIVDKKCKTCNHLEDRECLICDMCEESFHVSCLKHKVKVKDVEDFYCSTCKIKRKICPFNCPKKCKFSCLLNKMLDAKVEHNNRVRMGSQYQAYIPEHKGQNSESLESPLVGVTVSLEEKIREKEQADANLKNNTWEKGWKPTNSLPQSSNENWLQCQAIIYMKGEKCRDGKTAKRHFFCEKWRRAPLSEVQTDKWDCSCAVVWDPHHADCFVPQELETEEIERRMKEQ